MKLANKTIIVTGGAQGIGAAMVRRFAAEGANVVVVDINDDAAQCVAESVGGLGVACDVTRESDIIATVCAAEKHFGDIDMFCSNAGIAKGEPEHAASASNEVWQMSWDVHVMSHVYAARAVLPGMLNRGNGYLLQMCSAAGLLSQIGNSAYSATKHAALGFAESLSITHGKQGIVVSVICPQYVATPMLGYADDGGGSNVANVIAPETVADAVIKGVEKESFLILPHPEVSQYIQLKSANYDKWLIGMRKLRANVIDDAGSIDLQTMHKYM